MVNTFKLRHLDQVVEDDSKKWDIASLMIDVLNYKKSFFRRKAHLRNSFSTMMRIVKEVRKREHTTYKLNENSPINSPDSVDEISYLAMLNLQGAISQDSDSSMSEYISSVISIVAYTSTTGNDYKPDSEDFINFKESIKEEPMSDMIGLYNWILEDFKKSNKEWGDRFFSVEIVDKDYDRAGGQELSQFNVINTVKTLCADFNTPEKDVWNFSYAMVMTNSYSKAYASYITENIKKFKEAEIKKNRKF